MIFPTKFQAKILLRQVVIVEAGKLNHFKQTKILVVNDEASWSNLFD